MLSHNYKTHNNYEKTSAIFFPFGHIIAQLLCADLKVILVGDMLETPDFFSCYHAVSHSCEQASILCS